MVSLFDMCLAIIIKYNINYKNKVPLELENNIFISEIKKESGNLVTSSTFDITILHDIIFHRLYNHTIELRELFKKSPKNNIKSYYKHLMYLYYNNYIHLIFID